jgi:DNA repair exonuclease SbcCD nuclease subunit
VNRDGVHVALFHGSEHGDFAFQKEEGKEPHAPFRAAEIQAAGFHHALLGHFHAPRNETSYTYPGNPDPLTFGEDGERGAVLLTVADDGSVRRERYQVAQTMVSDIPVDLTGITHSSQVTGRVKDAVAGLSGTVRVTLSGDVAPDVDLRLQDIARLNVPNLDALLPRLGRVSVAYNIGDLQKEQTVRGQFVRDVLASRELDEDQRRRVLVTGLRALDGRSDELEVL